jgi:hypothetical protein
MANIIIYIKGEKVIHKLESIKGSIRSTKSIKKIKNIIKSKRKKIPIKPRLVSNHHTKKQKKKIKKSLED